MTDPRVATGQPPSTRCVALLDWDGSLHRGHTLRSWTGYLREQGVLRAEMAEAIEVRFAAHEDGDFPYSRLTIETPDLYARGLEGVAPATLRAHARAYVEEDSRALFPYSRALLEGLVDRKIDTVVISGSPIETLDMHQERLPLRELWGITLEERDGRFTGELALNPAEQTAKERIVSTAHEHATVVLAIGDSEADLPMLEAAEARIVIDNEALFEGDEATLHLSTDSLGDGAMAALNAFMVRSLDR